MHACMCALSTEEIRGQSPASPFRQAAVLDRALCVQAAVGSGSTLPREKNTWMWQSTHAVPPASEAELERGQASNTQKLKKGSDS